MTRFAAVTPNLLVRDVKRSTEFYRDVLGFTMGETVPDQEGDCHIITFAERVTPA